MSLSAMDTAKLPRSCTEPPAPLAEDARECAPHAPAAADRVSLASVAEPIPPLAGRRALREERRQLRRQQRRYAAAGIAALAVVFILAVVVLGGVR